MFILNIKKRSINIFIISTLIISCSLFIPHMAFSVKNIKKEITLPIIMYHSILKNPSSQGKYVISPATLEEDFKYLKENGYTAVLSHDLINFVNGGDICEKPVMITFDDGHLNNLTYVFDLLEKYDLKAVVSAVGIYTEKSENEKNRNPAYSYLNFEEIKTLIASGRVELANHSYDLHKLDGRAGTSIILGEKVEDYKKMLFDDLNKAQNLFYDKLSMLPAIFTYPFGSCCESSKDVIKNVGFSISLGCEEKLNTITRNPQSLYCLGRFNRQSGIQSSEFMKKLK